MPRLAPRHSKAFAGPLLLTDAEWSRAFLPGAKRRANLPCLATARKRSREAPWEIGFVEVVAVGGEGFLSSNPFGSCQAQLSHGSRSMG